MPENETFINKLKEKLKNGIGLNFLNKYLFE